LGRLLNISLPGAKVTWSAGSGEAGVETYQDVFISAGGVRTRISRLQLSNLGATAQIEASGLVVNLDGDTPFSLEIETLMIKAGPAHFIALADPSRLFDLCAMGPEGAELEARRVRLVRNLKPVELGGSTGRAETRIEKVTVGKSDRRTPAGCAADLSLRVIDHQEIRSDQSGMTILRYEADLSLPRNLPTLAAGDVSDLTFTGNFGGAEHRLQGGTTAATARNGSVSARIGAVSLTPALTTALRTRGEPVTARVLATINALMSVKADLSLSARGVILKPEDLIPTNRASGLSRGSLSNLIGDYDLLGQSEGGNVRLDLTAEVIGVGLIRFGAGAALSPYPVERTALSWTDPDQDILPPARLTAAEIRLRDDGLLRAIELITGFPVSVLASIYIEEGVSEAPEAWQPALKRVAGDMARFFSLTSDGEGGRLSLTTPTDLTLQETVRLFQLRPDLAEQLYRIEVGPIAD